MWFTKSLFSAFSLLSFGLLTNLPFVNLIKAASFHGYLQACSKVPFLRNPRFKQIAKHGPWHSESNLDPKSRMGYWGGVVNRKPSDYGWICARKQSREPSWHCFCSTLIPP